MPSVEPQATVEMIAQAISLKVLADAPDSRGPFVLEGAGDLDHDRVGYIREAWERAFRMAGRPTPPLLIIGAGITLRSATADEASDAG